MKKVRLLTFLGLGLLSVSGLVFGATKNTGFKAVYAEPGVEEPAPEEPTDEPVEVFECSVVIAEAKHGEISVDKTEGHVGDLVTITAKHDILYTIESASVNGSALLESEDTEGLFTFALVEGENKVEIKFVIDQELLGEMSVIMDQAINKDWTHLFSVENVIRIVSFLLNGGLLFAMVRYFIKDKKIAKTVENKVGEVLNQIVPETTKDTVIKMVEQVVAPIFAELKLDNEEMKNALTVFSRCLALSQEGTPEAKLAITKELSSLKLSDIEAISAVKKTIEDFIAEQTRQMQEMLEKMNAIEATNKEIIENSSNNDGENNDSSSSNNDFGDDGTQI